MTSCSSPQAQGGHLPLRLLGGRVVSGSHPAHLQVRLHRVLRLQLQHRPGGSLRPAARLPPGALTPGHTERRDFTRFSMTFMMLVKSGDFGNVFFFFKRIFCVQGSVLETTVKYYSNKKYFTSLPKKISVQFLLVSLNKILHMHFFSYYHFNPSIQARNHSSCGSIEHVTTAALQRNAAL